ncbi:MAG: zinc ribbon domain-containing protein [Prevotella sp.]|nr:zinc ribbon domain-containing protein [Prevotella sp.]
MIKIRSVIVAALSLVVVVLTSCYHDRAGEQAGTSDYRAGDIDSLSFISKHHYSENYNFVVKSDSFFLLRQQPEELLSGMATDSVMVYRHEHIVVADIRIIPNDSIDSVWVQVARDQSTFGWIHESEMLPYVVPNDPISQFISTFSDIHLLMFLIIISVIAVAYLMITIFKRNAKIVHFNDINTFYPTSLALVVALSATLYASIQKFVPDVWLQFYYHPTLNPFIVPPILSVFLVTVWAILIIGIATIDVVRTLLSAGNALLYLCGLAGVCAVNYIVFSITTLYYIGYVIFVVYCYYSFYVYYKKQVKGASLQLPPIGGESRQDVRG